MRRRSSYHVDLQQLFVNYLRIGSHRVGFCPQRNLLTRGFGAMTKTAIIGILLASSAAVASPAQAANLLVNGGFEAPPINTFFQNFGPGSTGISGWTVDAFTPFGGSGGNVDIVNGAFTPGGPSPAAEGSQFLDLVGFGSVGSIYQTFSTVAGQAYELNFAYSHNIFGGSPSKSADVGIYGGVFSTLLIPFQTITHNTGSASNLDWRRQTYSFVATGSQSTVAFGMIGQGNDNAGVLLDDLSVSAVPEPATWAMMILGFGLVGGMMRRRRVNVSYA
jgi:hypothetical protein